MHPADRPDDPMDPALPPLRDPLFNNLRSELAAFDTPPGVRKELLAALAKQQAAVKRTRPWWQRLPALSGAGAVLAMLLVTVFLVRSRPFIPADVASDTPARFGAFIALDTFERIAQDPDPHVLATEVPRTSLVSLGVAVNPQDAGDMVQAEMLVGAAGNPLALRLALE